MIDNTEDKSHPVVLVDVLYATTFTGFFLWILTLESVQEWLFDHWFIGIVSLAAPFVVFPASMFASRDVRANLRG